MIGRTNITVTQSEADKGTALTYEQTAQLQAAGSQGIGSLFALHTLLEVLQTIIATNHLYAVSREYHCLTIRHVDAMRATHNGSDHHPVFMTKGQFTQAATRPCTIIGHFEFGYVNVAIGKPTSIARFCAVGQGTCLTRTKVL